MFGFIKKLFGTQQKRDLKKLKPYIKKINVLYAKLAPLTNDELRAETNKLRQYIASRTKSIEDAINTYQALATKTKDIKTQFKIFSQIDKLKAKHNLLTEKILLNILPQAFAIIKETARRFKENPLLTVIARDFDKELAQKYDHITLEGNKAHWANTWKVGGNMITWDMLHYDVQLMGGVVLHQGKIAEMGTGEGKTLAGTLPIFLNALSKKGVHVITVNDYLAKRDTAWMGPIFQFHGLSVACIQDTPIQSQERKTAYQADITYGTSSSFAFDYLYDNIAKNAVDQVQRDYFYAIIDEIDEALIDGARTPYIISGARNLDNSKVYRSLKPRVKQMYQVQQRLVTDLLKNAKEKIANKKKAEGGLSLFRAYRGLPNYGPLISYLSQKGIKKILADTESYYLEENSKRMPEADEPLFFTLDKKTNIIDITDKGIQYFTKKDDKENFFILPNIAVELNNIEKSNEEKEIKEDKKAEMMQDYSKKTTRIHIVQQLLKAYVLFKKNVDYIVINGKVKLVDQKTGRMLKGRRLSNGTHEAIEAKEDVRIAKASQTYATITPSNLFRRYKKLSGMTGTAIEEAQEFLEIYNLEIVVIPPNKPVIRKDLEDRIYKTEREKFSAIANMVKDINQKTNRPILVITPSVDISDRIRKLLNVPPNKVLNAKNHHLEANIIAKAGEPNVITVATQMAGRGTDIKVADEAEKNGGLCVIITEKHETCRVENQVKGRAGRQGQQGSTVCFMSLEDDLIVHWQQGPLGRKVDKIWKKEGEVLIDKMISKLITGIQKDKAQNYFLSRKRALEYDNVMEKQREVIYRRRNHALTHQRLTFDTLYAIYNTIEAILPQKNITTNEASTIDALVDIGLEREKIEKIFKSTIRAKIIEQLYHLAKEQQQQQQETLAEQLYDNIQKIENEQKNKKEQLQQIFIPIQCGEEILPIHIHIANIINSKGTSIIVTLQSIISLETIDKLWTEHLEHMTELQDFVRTATYSNKDPLLVYKIESVNIFKKLLFNINKTITKKILTFSLIQDKITLQKHSILPSSEEIELETKHENSNEQIGEYILKNTNSSILDNTVSRNERITVRYLDGTTKEGIKFKTVVNDIEEGKCIIVEKN